jgi:ubiquinone/menaquinone biosynthesis C-methylase UbiE
MLAEQKLILNYFKNHTSHLKQVKLLDLSKSTSFYGYEHVKVKSYFQFQCTRLPFTNQSFDFVFNLERDRSTMFISPLTNLNELMRVSKKGLIQGHSPLDTIIKPLDYIVWTEPYCNFLCILPYYGPVPIRKRSEWLDLINFNPLYLNNYYHWDNPLEVNIQTHFGELEYTEYARLYNHAIEQSAEHTRNIIKKYLH